MASAKPKKDSEPGIMDVSKPGKAKPSATSKPIIITNRPMLQDPMVVEGESGQADSPVSPAKSKLTIQPISVKDGNDTPEEAVTPKTDKAEEPLDTTAAAQPEPAITDEATPEPAAEEPAKAGSEPATATPPKEEKPEPEPAAAETTAPAAEPEKEADEDTATNNEEADKADKNAAPMSPEEQEAAAKKADEEKSAHNAAIQKLVDSEQYFLPINGVESRKTKRFIALGALLIILLAAAWVDVALDAGLVQLGSLKPVTHFFAAKPVSTTSRLVPAATKSYAAPVAKLTFHYPSTWKLSSDGSTAQADVVALNPLVDNATASVAASFLTQYTFGKSSFTVKYVHYQKLAQTLGGTTVYLRDLVYQDSFGHTNLVASLGNDNTVKAGQKLTTVDQDFLNPDGQTRSLFAITTFKSGKGTVGFASVAEAQQFISTTQYQQARSILLSLTAAKS